MDNYREFVEELVRKAGTRLKTARENSFEVLHKGDDPRNVVTSVDLELDQFLSSEIKTRFPEHRVYSEEDVQAKDATMHGYEWVLDPIDGSANFSRGIPHFSVCAALLQDGLPIAGAVYNPVTDELFSFEKGKGVLLNGKTVSVSPVAEAKDAQVIFILGHNAPLWDWGTVTYRSLIEGTKKLKAFGSSSLDLCFLAAGRADVVAYGTLTTRDCAGAIGMVREAGGEVYNLRTFEPVEISETPQPLIATSSGELLKNIRPLLHSELLPS